MSTYTWDGGTGYYNDPTQWTPNGTPGTGDTAIIDSGNVEFNDYSVPRSYMELNSTVAAGTTLTLLSSSLGSEIVTLGAPTDGGAYVFQITGVDTLGGMLDGPAPGLVTSFDPVVLDIQGSGIFINEGTVDLGDGVLNASAEFDNPSLMFIGGAYEANGAYQAGELDFSAAFINDGQVEANGGIIVASAPITGSSGTIDLANLVTNAGVHGSQLTVSNSVSAGQVVDMSAGEETLLLQATGGSVPDGRFAGTIVGFSGADVIEIDSTVPINGVVFAGNEGTLYSNGTAVVHLDITGNYASNAFTVTADASVKGQYDVTLASLCFLGGTTVATPGGARAIETLAAGDLVLTADGLERPVRWLGRQTVATRFADPLRVAPIRVRAGALGDNLPVRDLLVSPDHALMVDGVFVQAGALVNGVSITREDANLPATFVYYHVELADHSLILAEGVPAETFIDNVDRLAFDNWDEHDAAGAPMAELPHARAKSHRQVPQALRARLMARGCELFGREVAAVA